MAFTSDQLDALEAAISQGTLSVKFQDREVKYQSLNELLKLRDLIRRSLQDSKEKSRIYSRFDKAL